MGLLIKFQETKGDTLLWWKKLSNHKRIEAASIWQESLPERNIFKNWSFTMVTNSSSVINNIYNYFNDIS